MKYSHVMISINITEMSGDYTGNTEYTEVFTCIKGRKGQLEAEAKELRHEDEEPDSKHIIFTIEDVKGTDIYKWTKRRDLTRGIMNFIIDPDRFKMTVETEYRGKNLVTFGSNIKTICN